MGGLLIRSLFPGKKKPSIDIESFLSFSRAAREFLLAQCHSSAFGTGDDELLFYLGTKEKMVPLVLSCSLSLVRLMCGRSVIISIRSALDALQYVQFTFRLEIETPQLVQLKIIWFYN